MEMKNSQSVLKEQIVHDNESKGLLSELNTSRIDIPEEKVTQNKYKVKQIVYGDDILGTVEEEEDNDEQNNDESFFNVNQSWTMDGISFNSKYRGLIFSNVDGGLEYDVILDKSKRWSFSSTSDRSAMIWNFISSCSENCLLALCPFPVSVAVVVHEDVSGVKTVIDLISITDLKMTYDGAMIVSPAVICNVYIDGDQCGDMTRSFGFPDVYHISYFHKKGEKGHGDKGVSNVECDGYVDDEIINHVGQDLIFTNTHFNILVKFVLVSKDGRDMRRGSLRRRFLDLISSKDGLKGVTMYTECFDSVFDFITDIRKKAVLKAEFGNVVKASEFNIPM